MQTGVGQAAAAAANTLSAHKAPNLAWSQASPSTQPSPHQGHEGGWPCCCRACKATWTHVAATKHKITYPHTVTTPPGSCCLLLLQQHNCKDKSINTPAATAHTSSHAPTQPQHNICVQAVRAQTGSAKLLPTAATGGGVLLSRPPPCGCPRLLPPPEVAGRQPEHPPAPPHRC